MDCRVERAAAHQRSRSPQSIVGNEVEARQSAGARSARKRLYGGLEARPREAARGGLAESLENVSLHNQSGGWLPSSVTYTHGCGAIQTADLEGRGAHRRAYEMHTVERPADIAEATGQSAQPVVAHRARGEQRARQYQPTDRVHNAMPRLQGQIDHAALAEPQPSRGDIGRTLDAEQRRWHLRELHRRYARVGLVEPQVVIVRVTWAQGRAYFDPRAACDVVSGPRPFSGLRRAIQRVVDSWRRREAEAPKIGEGWRRVAGSEAPLRDRRDGQRDGLRQIARGERDRGQQCRRGLHIETQVGIRTNDLLKTIGAPGAGRPLLDPKPDRQSASIHEPDELAGVDVLQLAPVRDGHYVGEPELHS